MIPKVTKAGDACRHCSTPVVRVEHEPGFRPKTRYWFEWWFKCPRCNAIYFVEAARRERDPSSDNKINLRLFDI